MKDKLEKFIQENREGFDLYEPNPDIWKKIEKGVNKRSINWNNFIWRAAVIILLVGFSFLFYDYLENRDISSRNRAKDIEIPELKEAEIYYTHMLNKRLKEIQPILVHHPELDDELKTDLSELDSIYSELQKDLNDNVANHEVIEAMIQNYRLRLNILEDILNELKNNGKTKDDEKSKVDI